MEDIAQLNEEYGRLLAKQQFTTPALDYSILEGHLPFLNHISEIGNSGITVFDFHKKQHVFTSHNYTNLFGYDLEEASEKGIEYFDSKIHPEDHIRLIKNGITILEFYFGLPKAVRKDYKLINEYRVQNHAAKYIRVIEQHQVLELDSDGNLWLALSVMDIAPNQDAGSKFSSQVINFRNGEIILLSDIRTKPVKQILSERELSILNLVKDGLLSKEISGLLSISVHTVNTHRQRILEKLNVSNTVEAINYARNLGLLS